MTKLDDEDVRVVVELSDAQALALAQFVKRLTLTSIRAHAAGEREAYLMDSALIRLRSALGESGYAPR